MNSLGKSISLFWNSSIGKKIVVAVTGLALVGFLLGHMVGNLLVFAGKDALNDYAWYLHHMAHGKGIWIARIGLLVSVVLHILATISLTLHNKKSRTEKYAHEQTSKASRSSRLMIVSGLVILAFIIFHIFHFTVRVVDPELGKLKEVVPDQGERHDVHAMVIKGFQVPWVAIFYIVAISLLCSHLSHGIASIFQTLGLRSRKTAGATKAISWGITAVLWVGFLIIPISVLLKIVNEDSGGKKQAAATEVIEVNAQPKGVRSTTQGGTIGN